MNEWKESTLKEIIDSANTGLDAIKRAPIVPEDTGIKCLRIQDISQGKEFKDWGFTNVEQRNYEKFRLRKGDIIIARTGNTIGVNRYFENDQTSVFNNGLIRLRVNKEKACPKYIYYNLRSKYFKDFIDSISGGTSTQPNMQIEVLLTLDINIPPLQEQERIAEVLSSLDDKIDLLQRNNKTLEQLAETLFRQWFVEDAKEDWEEKSLDQIAEYLNGLALQKFPAEKGKPSLPAIKIREMNQGITEATDRVSFNLPPKYIIENGDILFSWSGSLDVIIWTGGQGALNQHLFKVSSNTYPKWLIYFATRLFLPEFRDIANDKATTMGHIQRGHLTQSTLKLPDIETIKKYDKTISGPFNKIINNQLQIQQLETLRDTLLPKLMSGHVRVN